MTERSAHPPSPAVQHMDHLVMEYLQGRASLDAAVAGCVAALGPRPTLTISLAHADAGVQRRLATLEVALAELRARTG